MVLIRTERFLIADFERVILFNEPIDIQIDTVEKIKASFDFLNRYSQDKVIYGINTGLGPMAQYKISEADQKQLQLNLIRSHCSGAGNPMSPEHAKATMLARLTSLVQGLSGVHPNLAELIKNVLNSGLVPLIFEKGGVGASGDLVQLAHLALNLIGEGEMLVDGRWTNAGEALHAKGIVPIKIHVREGLALLNGTSAMTGIGALNVLYAKRLLNVSVALSAMANEAMKSFDDHFSMELNAAKAHPGQAKVAAAMREFLADSKLIRSRADHLYHRKIEEAVFTDKVQEYYSLRCIPQILGPVLDTWLEVKQVVEDELNSANDNPIIDAERQHVYHGGNFHGDYVALAMDKLKIVVTKLTMLAERQLNYLLNDKLNQKLSPFINTGKLGLNFGLQGIQFTATSTTAENQTLSNPMYVHSISNNNDNQDIVSMGCNAALMTRRVIDNAFDVLAIHASAVCQAIDYLDCHARLATNSKKMHAAIRAQIPTIAEDLPRYEQLKKVRQSLIEIGANGPLLHS